MRTVWFKVSILIFIIALLFVWSAYLAKVYLIEHDLVGMADTPEACDESQDCYNSQSKLVVPFALRGLFRSALELVDRVLCVDNGGCFCFCCAALSPSLTYSIGGHDVLIRA